MTRSVLAAIALLLAAAAPIAAQEITFFRIGTGSTGETHFPVGGLIASAISNPPGSRQCEKGGSCGVPGLIAVAQSTHGAGDNIRALAEGRLEAALVQADIAHAAFHGTGPYASQTPIDSLRMIAQLYPDNMHVVVRRDSGISTIRDLKGKRVSLGEAGSGTLIDARAILAAHGLKEQQIAPIYAKAGVAADMLAKRDLDAFFVLDGAPVPTVAELARAIPVTLLPIHGQEAEALRRSHPFFLGGSIAAGTYAGQVSTIPTLDVGVVLLVGARVPAERVYGIARALWHPSTRKLLAQGHPRGKLIRLESATGGVGIPLHAGAARYYAEAGVAN